MEEDESQKIFDPSPRKLEEARKKGDVVKSADVAALLILAVASMVLLNMGGRIGGEIIEYCRTFIERPHEIAVDGGALQRLMLNVLYHIGIALATLFGAMSIAALAGHTGQSGLLFATDKLMPKADKISPIAGFKRIFGKDALVQFGKTLFKVLVLGIVAYYVIKPKLLSTENLITLEPTQLGGVIGEILKELLMKLLIVLGIFAGADYFFQHMSFMKRNKMSKHEMKEEFKNTEGDPLIQSKLRQLRQKRARERMMQNVPKASVIITNPTHYAVALRYVAGENAAPICLAKGVDRIALKIREVAGQHNIPIIEDPPLARALFASVDIEETIPAEFYQAVAKIIGTILNIASKRKSPQSAA
jgi:flagellar biosynthesis protein FlhB